jgi:dienelactone hydrolase
MGLFTSMQPPGDLAGRARFILARLDSLPLTIHLEVRDTAVDSARVVRWFQGPGVVVRELRGSRPLGRMFYPPGRGRRPAVLVMGGSEGGFGGDDVAALLASRGYVALSLAYFGTGPLPASLERIPLEYFFAAVDSLQGDARVHRGRLAVLGTSKGAEAALLLAAHDPRLRAVVVYAPSAVAWSCICPNAQSPSWTLTGQPVAFIPGGADPDYRPAAGSPLHPVVNYRYRLRDTATVRRAEIPVERIHGPVLLVAGQTDELWPSAWSADAITGRLRAHGFRHRVVHLSYPGAGHLIGKAYLPAGSTRVGGGRLETGGTPQANAAAQADAWPRVLRFLATALK